MSPPAKRRAGKMMRKMMNRVPLVGHVGIAMALMCYGFTVISAKDGSMANV
ncbi:hypothetical protein CCACVL1_19747 [Corchorus capsularis]|uniref:Uncharacterized protein n=1 Tax=Corchorus capsularis TaxID=210143 RepID=A0A1R3HF60_COCAP|nr:hypothetical protein CCACVL1_19747 [Corchorus capsularis]